MLPNRLPCDDPAPAVMTVLASTDVGICFAVDNPPTCARSARRATLLPLKIDFKWTGGRELSQFNSAAVYHGGLRPLSVVFLLRSVHDIRWGGGCEGGSAPPLVRLRSLKGNKRTLEKIPT